MQRLFPAFVPAGQMIIDRECASANSQNKLVFAHLFEPDFAGVDRLNHNPERITGPAQPKSPKVVDIMSALKRSLESQATTKKTKVPGSQ